MTLILTPEQEALIMQSVAGGQFGSPLEAVNEALRRLYPTAPHLSRDESHLLLVINKGLSEIERTRFDALTQLRCNDQIAPDENRELTELAEKSERFDAERMKALASLAQLRGVTLDEIMAQLGIVTPDVLG